MDALSEVFLFLADAVRIDAAQTRSDLIHQRQKLARRNALHRLDIVQLFSRD
jgi:hypothetical protein